MRTERIALVFILVVLLSHYVLTHSQEEEAQEESTESRIDHLLQSEHLNIGVSFMASYGHDGAQSSLGFEKQGRIGYAIVSLSGKADNRVSYLLQINPVDEIDPLPACGEEFFFYPNAPQNRFGPNVICSNEGNRRVDMYKGIALDNISQQGPIRQAYLDYRQHVFSLRFGRFILPIGLGWQEAGSFTAKDSTRIQRINAEANFGLMLTYRRSQTKLNIGAVLGDGNRNKDYDYFYFEDGTLDSNSALTGFISGITKPIESLEVRGALKYGFTGSKVERLPNYWASKRNDHAIVGTVRYKPIEYASVFGEIANYTWGPTSTSAAMLGFDQEPIKKVGYYVGIDAGYPVNNRTRIGFTLTGEEIDRKDSLIKFLATNKLYRVTMDEKDRAAIMRIYIRSGTFLVGFYCVYDDNSFPWVSGIWPVSGPRAFVGRPPNKWGLTVTMDLK